MKAEILFRNTMSNGFFKILNLILSIITFIILFNILPQKTYGELLLLQSILMIFGAFDLGTGTALEKYIPNYLSDNSKHLYYSNLSTLIVIHIAIGLTIFIFFFALAPIVLTEYVNIGPFDPITWLFIGMILSFFYPLQALVPALKGHSLFPELNYTLFICNLVGNVLLVFSALFTDSIVILLLSKYVVNIWLFSKHVKILQIKSPFKLSNLIINFSSSSKFIKFGLWIFINKLSSLIVHQFDKIIVSMFLGPTSIPFYYAALRIIQIPIDVNEILKSAVIPAASKIKSRNKKDSFIEFLTDGIMQLNSIFSFMVFIVILFSYELLFVIGGNELASYNFIIQISCLLLLPIAGRGFFSNALIGSGEVLKRQAAWSILSAISFLLLLIYFINNYELNGSIIAKSVNHFLMHGMWIFLIARFTELGAKKFIVITLKSQWPILLVSLLYLFFIQNLFERTLNLLAIKIILAIIMFFVLWMFFIDTRIKNYLLKVCKKLYRFNY